MTSSTYKRITTLCFVAAVVATLIVDRFPGSRVVAAILGLGAVAIATITYLKNQACNTASEHHRENVEGAVAHERDLAATQPRVSAEEGGVTDISEVAWSEFPPGAALSRGPLVLFYSAGILPRPQPQLSDMLQIVRGLAAIEADAEYQVSLTSSGLSVRIRRYSKEPREEQFEQPFFTGTRTRVTYH